MDFRQIPPQQPQIPQQQQQQLPPPYDFQGQQSQLPQTQQCELPASSDTPPALPNSYPFNRGFVGPLPDNGACVGFGQTYAYPYGMDASQGLYGGVNGVVTGPIMGGHTNGLEIPQFMFQQPRPGPGYPDSMVTGD